MKTYKIAILAGDGIGPEIMRQAEKVLRVIEKRNEIEFILLPTPFGASAYFETGKSFPQESIDICDSADTILKGTIGLGFEESQKIPIEERPERGALLPLRKRYNTYANFRPVFLPADLAGFSPLKKEVVGSGVQALLAH